MHDLELWAPDVTAAIIDAGPFAGCSLAKAQIVNDVFSGHLVEVVNVAGRNSAGIFVSLGVPSVSGRHRGTPWEVVIATRQSTLDTWSSQTTWHIGVHAIAHLDVISPDPYRYCDHCGRWVLPDQMIDLGSDWEVERRWCCRAMDVNGQCL